MNILLTLQRATLNDEVSRTQRTKLSREQTIGYIQVTFLTILISHAGVFMLLFRHLIFQSKTVKRLETLSIPVSQLHGSAY